MKSFYIDDSEIADKIILQDKEHLHLSKVLRTKVGEEVCVYNNTQHSYYCIVESVNKNQSVLKVVKKEYANTNPKARLDVFIALLKGEKFEFLITKLTELGASKIIPFNSQFCNGKDKGNKAERYRQIAKDACKQCKRTKLIEIEDALNFEQMLQSIENYDVAIFAYENQDKGSLSDVLEKIPQNSKVAVIIGSEGGFSEKEAEMISQTSAIAVSLGNRILRAETACIMLSSIVLYKLNEFNIN